MTAWRGAGERIPRAARPLAVLALAAVLAPHAACERRDGVPPPPAPIEPQEEQPPLGGAAGRGQELFHNPIDRHPPCVACHEVGTPRVRIGPPLQSIGVVAGQRRPDQDARAYLRESIVEPDAYVVPGYSEEVMPESYGRLLDDEEIDALIAYLMTRTGESR